MFANNSTIGAATVPTADVQRLVDEIVELAARPLERSQALPPSVYTSPGLYELELERIWRHSWLHVGRVEELEKRGDWITANLVGEPVMVVRGQDDKLRAMSRVCPHRYMDVLGDAKGRRGNKEQFVCPYHSWSFGLNGQLTGAPLMSGSEVFAEERDAYCLIELPLTEWQGFLFVNLDQGATPLAPSLTQVDAFLGNYDLAEWRLVDTIEWGETEANWKLVVDNGREAYHHQGTHRDSLEPLWPAHMVEYEASDSSDFFLLRMFVSPEAATGQEDGHYINPTLVPAAPRLTPFERSHYMVIGVYPGFIVAPGPDAVFTLSWMPTSPTKHTLDIGIYLHESRLDHPNIDGVIEEARAWITLIQSQDAAAIQSVQRSATTRLIRRGGALSHLERPVWTFQRFLAERLAGVRP